MFFRCKNQEEAFRKRCMGFSDIAVITKALDVIMIMEYCNSHHVGITGIKWVLINSHLPRAADAKSALLRIIPDASIQEVKVGVPRTMPLQLKRGGTSLRFRFLLPLRYAFNFVNWLQNIFQIKYQLGNLKFQRYFSVPDSRNLSLLAGLRVNNLVVVDGGASTKNWGLITSIKESFLRHPQSKSISTQRNTEIFQIISEPFSLGFPKWLRCYLLRRRIKEVTFYSVYLDESEVSCNLKRNGLAWLKNKFLNKPVDEHVLCILTFSGAISVDAQKKILRNNCPDESSYIKLKQHPLDEVCNSNFEDNNSWGFYKGSLCVEIDLLISISLPEKIYTLGNTSFDLLNRCLPESVEIVSISGVE